MFPRLLIFALTAAATCAASLWWLHHGDLSQAVDPSWADWDAATLAKDAGVPAE